VDKVYIETSIPSFVVARPASHIISAARQLLAIQWWQTARHQSQCFISDIVLLEASRGDQDAVEKRLNLLKGINRLPITEEATNLSQTLLGRNTLPSKAREDSLHLSLAIIHEMDLLLTWNCRHIANPTILRQIRKVVGDLGLTMPEIATPEEVLGTA